MLKSILENKISSKLNNFNNAGKLATEWIDKFRNSLDIAELPGNGLNGLPHDTNTSLNGESDSLPNSSSQITNGNGFHDENISPNMIETSAKKSKMTNNSGKQLGQNSNSDPNMRRSIVMKKKSSISFDDTNGAESNDENDNSSKNSEISSVSSSAPNRLLVRQLTELTATFPLKPFQRVNSQTVEIPGLNVKVVRYRIEDDLGKIEPRMYIKYNTGCGESLNGPSRGKLYFNLFYNEDIHSLSVTILKADIIASPHANQANNKPDTYVKIQLLPDKKKKYQTRIERRNLNPSFEETFYFQVPIQDLPSRYLYLTLLDFGRFSKNSLIGSVRVNDIQSIKDISTKEIDFVRNLQPLAEVRLPFLFIFLVLFKSSLSHFSCNHLIVFFCVFSQIFHFKETLSYEEALLFSLITLKEIIKARIEFLSDIS